MFCTMYRLHPSPSFCLRPLPPPQQLSVIGGCVVVQADVAVPEPGDGAAGLLAGGRGPGPLVRRRREPQEQVAAGPRAHPHVALCHRQCCGSKYIEFGSGSKVTVHYQP